MQCLWNEDQVRLGPVSPSMFFHPCRNHLYQGDWHQLLRYLARSDLWAICKHLPNSMATSKGHLRQDLQKFWSTKPPAAPPTTPYSPRVCTHKLFYQTIKSTGKIATDQTGRFPATSSRGSKYIMILYEHDSNTILPKTMKSQSEHKLVRAYSALHSNLTRRVIRPTFQILDNECPASLKTLMRKEGVTFQLVPPHLHHTNDVERAIQTFNYHFVAALSSCDPYFPLCLWDRLLPQATLTLNLLCPYHINPRLSAEAQLNGAFGFNKIPLSPSGTKVLIFEPSTTRCTWAPHGIQGWYIGTAPEHYRCYHIYVPKNRVERVAKTVQFFPDQCVMPVPS